MLTAEFDTIEHSDPFEQQSEPNSSTGETDGSETPEA
jgi:hypothetical protein